jgi:hypothetical protein
MTHARATEPRLRSPVDGPATAMAHRPSLRWLHAWMQERFPVRNAVFFLVFYVTAACVAQVVVGRSALTLGWRDVLGFVALYAFFLMLRVFDEHKDFADDLVAHPNRVLQRGLVTLGDLKIVGAVAIAAQIATSLWLGRGVGATILVWIAVYGWSVLMAREFFARTWLRGRLMVYALSHMIVMPLVAWWAMTMQPDVPVTVITTSGGLAFAGLAFFGGLAFEMARKMRAPKDEHPQADSYTKALGVRAAAIVLCIVVVVAQAVIVLCAASLRGAASAGVLAVAVAATIGVLWAAHAFTREATAAAAKRLEAIVGVSLLVGHIAVIWTAFAVAR